MEGLDRMFTRTLTRPAQTGLIRLAPVTVLAMALAFSGTALAGPFTITPTFTAAFNTDFGANAAAAQASFIAATQIFTNAFVDPININISVDAVTGTGTLGQSNTPIGSISWANLDAAVIADAKSASDHTAIGVGGSITAADPSGGADTWWLTSAQNKALGSPIAGFTPASDGTITVGTGFSYTFNDSGGVAAGTYDLTDVFAHEISEVLGRIGLSGATIGSSPGLTLLDAFSYTGAGTRGLGNGNNNYFSINNGTTLIKGFNNQAGLGGDSRDWSSVNTPSNDAFNAFASTGTLESVSATDLQLMDVLGYDPAASSTPEPSTFVLLGASLVAGGLFRRRASKA